MCTLHYLRHNLLIFEADPSRVVPLDCSKVSVLSSLVRPHQCYHRGLLLHNTLTGGGAMTPEPTRCMHSRT